MSGGRGSQNLPWAEATGRGCGCHPGPRAGVLKALKPSGPWVLGMVGLAEEPSAPSRQYQLPPAAWWSGSPQTNEIRSDFVKVESGVKQGVPSTTCPSLARARDLSAPRFAHPWNGAPQTWWHACNWLCRGRAQRVLLLKGWVGPGLHGSWGHGPPDRNKCLTAPLRGVFSSCLFPSRTEFIA